ncbi:sigma-70 family RNA polymerase sigma factor [Variovorax sp. E3]|uniref:sigma-70 family RNA polymerase sigma factor n=1 Tax=Variovorax sp. E3 TaxID=1914993 RepID=UPI0018DB1CC6|nr:sigma-70 family RNA polymerase sigma factor [Variovorax sp. E3]
MNDLLLLVEPMIPALRRYARALLRDRESADELVQDCLERVISRWSQRRDVNDTRQWVFAILHNLAMHRLRQQSRRGLHVAMEDIDETELGTPAPQEHRVRHHELMRALDLLPEDQRAVLLLVAVEDLSYAQAAKTLEIPVGTVMSRLARARQRLHRMLDGVDPPPSAASPEAGQSARPHLRRLK